MMAKSINVSTPKYPNTFTLVDDEDYDRVVSLGKWQATHSTVKRCIKNKRVQKQILLHRFILEKYETVGEMVVDHINHNILDNRKSNLRVCSHAQNLRNKSMQKDNVVGYKGVRYSHRKSGLLKAEVMFNYMGVYLGNSHNKEFLAACYNYAAQKLFGEFAHLNEVDYELTQEQKDDLDLRIHCRLNGLKWGAPWK